MIEILQKSKSVGSQPVSVSSIPQLSGRLTAMSGLLSELHRFHHSHMASVSSRSASKAVQGRSSLKVAKVWKRDW